MYIYIYNVYIYTGIALHWILHNLRTVHNIFLCSDLNDPCTCPSFQVYKPICDFVKKNSTISNFTNINNFSMKYLKKSDTSTNDQDFNIAVILISLGKIIYSIT